MSLFGYFCSPYLLYERAIFSSPPSAPWNISNHLKNNLKNGIIFTYFLYSFYLKNKSEIKGSRYGSS
jgi:hypothetical protein